jgi:hypothetical protein
VCGMPRQGDTFCPHHAAIYGDDWAAGNRVMCDFVHRGQVPRRLGQAEREDEFWAVEGTA